MASFHMEGVEIERQLINDTDSDCGTDDSEHSEHSESVKEARGSETEVDEDPSSGQSA
jgi:hypothetical protein